MRRIHFDESEVDSKPEMKVSKLFYSFDRTIEPKQLSLGGVPAIGYKKRFLFRRKRIHNQQTLPL